MQLPLFDVVEIPLTKGCISIVDAVDADLIKFSWHCASNGCTQYAVRSIRAQGRLIGLSIHRLVLGRVLGRTLDAAELVDHVNRNGLDNRRSNLRLATPTQNHGNQGLSKNNTSGLKGVHFRKGRNKWRAMISKNGKMFHLGNFNTAEEAHAAYCKAALEYFGEFARLE